jgi:hypothetical protein
LRNCQSRIDLRGGTYAIAGIRGEIDRYAAADRFSDQWIDVEWLVEGRTLHAHITNRTQAPITIASAIVGGAEGRSGAVIQIGPGSSRNVALAELAVIQQYLDAPVIPPPNRAMNAVPVELRIEVAEKECSYQFQLAPGAV